MYLIRLIFTDIYYPIFGYLCFDYLLPNSQYSINVPTIINENSSRTCLIEETPEPD